jgi:hypothetical protein
MHIFGSVALAVEAFFAAIESLFGGLDVGFSCSSQLGTGEFGFVLEHVDVVFSGVCLSCSVGIGV